MVKRKWLRGMGQGNGVRYKGKTRLPVCRQISSGICRRVAGSIAWRHRQCSRLSSRQVASVIRFGSARGGHHDITCHLHRTHRVRQRDITGNLRPSDLGGFAAVEPRREGNPLRPTRIAVGQIRIPTR